MNFQMIHENYNVYDLEKSLAFYEKALGLHEKRRKNGDGFIIVYVGNDQSDFELELTWLKDRTTPYNLGDNEIHLAFVVDDFDAALEKHRAMNCVCYENPGMGVYFINDPDGYWIEILPVR